VSVSAPTALPPDPLRAWTAEIEWRGGGERSQFVVVARREGARRAVTIAQSRPLAWPPLDADSIRALGDAVRELEADLAGAGWTALRPGSAWYAKRLAWQPVGVTAPAAPEPPVEPALFAGPRRWPESALGRWRCEIRWDAGWSKARFHAVAYPPRGRRGRAVAASDELDGRLMAEPDPRSQAHRGQFERLAGALRDQGWEPAGAGAHWYGARFYWPGDAPPDRTVT
jgi:hypothetical protein